MGDYIILNIDIDYILLTSNSDIINDTISMLHQKISIFDIVSSKNLICIALFGYNIA